jgi:uncharacterized membrane protein
MNSLTGNTITNKYALMEIIRKFFLKPYIYILVVIAGTTLKFYRLDYKLYWFDEICTVQHTSGIPDGEYKSLVPVNKIKNIGFYHDLYHHSMQDFTVWAQLKGLFSGTYLTPLHYAFLIFWQRIVGDDFIHYRLFGVFIFIITLPFLFMFARTLFGSNLSGWIAVSLYSVSPYFHLFAQEARYYILWAFFLVILNYVFLKAATLNKMKWWIFYIITAILALYTSLFTGLIIFGHLIYTIILRRNLLRSFILYLVIIILGYMPWIYSMYINRQEIFSAMSWQVMEFHVPFWGPFLAQVFGFTRIFLFYFDFGIYRSVPQAEYFTADLFNDMWLTILVIAMIIGAFVYFIRKAKKEIIYFLLLIIVPGMMFFYISDVARNGLTSIWWRYIIFINIGILTVVVYLIYRKISMGKLLFTAIFAALVFIGITSIMKISHKKCWYTRDDCNIAVEDAQLISGASRPLVITDFSYYCGMGDFIVVLTECTSDSIDILYASPDIKDVRGLIGERKYSDIYVVHASNELVQNLKSQFGEKMDSLEYKRSLPMWRIMDY